MLIAAVGQYFFGITIFVTSMFLVLLVLVQRGRGGGIAGALGGAGGQSAFGTKAGDLFTRITIGVAAVWIFLCASAVFFLKEKEFDLGGGLDQATPSISSSEASAPTTESIGGGNTAAPAATTPETTTTP